MWERKIEAADRQKWSRLIGSHRLPRSILHPHPISHSHYACRRERLTVKKKRREKKQKKNTTSGSSQLQSCSLLLRRHAGVQLFYLFLKLEINLTQGSVSLGERRCCVSKGEIWRDIFHRVLRSTQLHGDFSGSETISDLWGQKYLRSLTWGKGQFVSTERTLVYRSYQCDAV